MSTNVFSPVAPELVVQNYFNLVQAIAKKIKRRLPAHVDINDLVQTGVIGLLQASSRYDISRAVDFSTYANSRITGAILDELRKTDTCSRHDRKKAREAEDTKLHLRAASGSEPSREQIAKAVGMGLAEYERILQRLEASKQTPSYCNEDEPTMPDEINRLPSKDESPYDSCSKREDLKLLKTRISHLKTRHQEVLRLYYFKEMGLKQIGERLGVGEARICQIHKQALVELRRLIETKRMPVPAVSSMIQ
ncbi:MAG TPA: FliA/WhiG family RNA polymerase sigma factor [Candidatus Angelobacter sp.]|nr:FliA/WhiG family RNA polymerase sigma factor [Candidatus Angelobacter sp.]